MNGWVKLHRKILDNDVFRNDRTAWHVFETLLVLADAKTGTWSGGTFQLAELTGENRATLYKAIIRLERKGMIARMVNAKYTVYNIGKWNEYQADGKRSVNADDTQSNTLTRIKNKEYIPKGIEAYGKPEINDLFDYWALTTGYPISSKVQPNRNAANNLLKKHGEKGVRKLIDGVNMAQQDKFAPRIGDFVDLQANLNKLLAWGKNNKAKNMEVIS